MELFIVWSPDVQVGVQQFGWEGGAQQEAEGLARQNRGARIFIAKVTALVVEPLPALSWSDGRPESQRDQCNAVNTVGGSPSPEVLRSLAKTSQAPNLPRRFA